MRRGNPCLGFTRLQKPADRERPPGSGGRNEGWFFSAVVRKAFSPKPTLFFKKPLLVPAFENTGPGAEGAANLAVSPAAGGVTALSWLRGGRKKKNSPLNDSFGAGCPAPAGSEPCGAGGAEAGERAEEPLWMR